MASQVSAQLTTLSNVQTGTYAPDKPSSYEGRQRIARGTVVTTSAVTAAGSQTISLFRLPKGAKMASLVAYLPASVGTSSAKFGISAGGTEFATGVDLSAAGKKEIITTVAGATYETLTEVTVYLTVVTTDFATAITAEFIGTYTVD